MKSFCMSKYVSLEDLYKDKAKHYEKLFRRAMDQLVISEDWRYNEQEDNYYNVHCGEYIDEDL